MSKWMKQLSKMEGAVDTEYDFFAPENVLGFPSPSVNWIFGKGHGLPFGYGALLFGPPKAGKSIFSNLAVGGLHAQDPEAMAVKFNTEMREAGQMEDYWGVDPNRYQAYDVNEPEFIFDRIKKDIFPMVQDGMPLKLIVIDSLQGIQGVKEAARDSVTNHLMGDHAKTIQDGLKAILPVIRRHKIALICTAHIRGNLDAGMYGPKEKMAGGWGQKHFFEYYIEIKRDNSAEGKKSVTGEAFETEVKDFRGKKEKTGHKIYIKNNDSSVGMGSGRSGQITIDYRKGLINTEEEVFELAKNIGAVSRPNNRTYIWNEGAEDEVKFASKGDFIEMIRENEGFRKNLLKKIYE